MIENSAFLTLISFSLCFGGIYIIRRTLSGTLFQDVPNHRSLHIEMTPKVGGLVIFPSSCICLVIANLLGYRYSEGAGNEIEMILVQVLWIFSAAPVFLVSVLNDKAKQGVSAKVRFIVFFFSSLALIFGELLLLSPQISLEGTLAGAFFNRYYFLFFILIVGTVGVLALVNFFNFMDGIDGLAGSMGAIGFATYGAIIFYAGPLDPAKPLTTILGQAALILSGACIGFLLWNWPKARVFMGDTGSTFLGFSAAALGWMGTFGKIWHWSMPFLVFFPFWFDATTTLLRRFFRREKLWQAHREHFYQRAVLISKAKKMERRHLGVLVSAIFLMLFSSFIAFSQHFSWLGLGQSQPWPAVVILLVTHSVLAWIVDRRYQAFTQV